MITYSRSTRVFLHDLRPPPPSRSGLRSSGLYLVYSGSYLPTCRDTLSVPFSGVKKSVIYGRLEMGPTVCTETAVRDYHHTLRNNPGEPTSELYVLVYRRFAKCIRHPAENCKMVTNADSRRMWPELVVGCFKLKSQNSWQAETKHGKWLWTIVSQIWSKCTSTNSETFSEYTWIVKAKDSGLDVRDSISDDVLLTLFHLTQYGGYNHGMDAHTVWHPLSHPSGTYRWLFPMGKTVRAWTWPLTVV